MGVLVFGRLALGWSELVGTYGCSTLPLPIVRRFAVAIVGAITALDGGAMITGFFGSSREPPAHGRFVRFGGGGLLSRGIVL